MSERKTNLSQQSSLQKQEAKQRLLRNGQMFATV
nr:MAG TPA: hypothetical protein [Caudoviricetes sp.]